MFRDVNHSRGSSPSCALVAMVLTISVDRRLDSLEAQRGMRKPEDPEFSNATLLETGR